METIKINPYINPSNMNDYYVKEYISHKRNALSKIFLNNSINIFIL